jgi:hypothetical protein
MPADDTPEPDAAATRIAAFPQRPEDRLRLALRRLEDALGEQSQAAQGLRAAIGDLTGTMARLGAGVAGYRCALDVAASEIERALAAARTLQGTADRMMV